MSHKSNVILLLLYFSWSNVSCRFSIMILTKLSILRMRYLMVSYIHVHSHSREEKSSETYLQRIDARATTVFCSLHAFRISRIRISQFQRTFLSSEKWILLNFTNLNIIFDMFIKLLRNFLKFVNLILWILYIYIYIMLNK